MIRLTSTAPLLILIIGILVFSCGNSEQNSFSLDKEREKILVLHNLQRDYHFGKDSVAFANQLSDNFISVNKGVISRPSKKETIARYNSYFSSVDFVNWDDLSEPIIKFSDDGSIAYTIVDKIVTTTYKDESGKAQTGETHFAWTAIYTKYNGEWKIDVVTSTEVPNNSN